MNMLENIAAKIEQEMPVVILKKESDTTYQLIFDINTSIMLKHDGRWLYLEADVINLSEWEGIRSVVQTELLRYAYRLFASHACVLYQEKQTQIVKLFLSITAIDLFDFDSVLLGFLTVVRSCRSLCEAVIAEESKVKTNIVIANTV
jgi:hypothetical protein